MIFTFPIRVYWEDTDAGGIVYYANYLKFFERARSEWLHSLNIHQKDLQSELNGGFVVRQAHIKYIRPAYLDDKLKITVKIKEINKASIEIEQQVFLSDDFFVLCEANIELVWVNLDNIKPNKIPNNIFNKIELQKSVKAN